MDINYIKQIADVMDEKALVELSIEENGQKISLKKGEFLNAKPSSNQVIENVEKPNAEEIKPKNQAIPITSPMVGTYYHSASPNGEPFVNVGDVVKKGQVVCIIEAMKLMNEIEAEASGRVVEICVENGQAIEFGQVLMYIE